MVSDNICERDAWYFDDNEAFREALGVDERAFCKLASVVFQDVPRKVASIILAHRRKFLETLEELNASL